MLKIGQRNHLVVKEIFPLGYILSPSEENADGELQDTPIAEHEVTLKDIDISYEVGQALDVFVYTHADGTLLASIASPKIMVDELKPLVLMGASAHGYFFDWGIKPDLYMPEALSHTQLDIGSTYVVKIITDKLGKLVGTTKIERFLNEDGRDLKTNQAVDILLYGQSPLGYKAAVNGEYQGLLYKSDLITSVRVGQSISGFIKHVREDGKIDLALQIQNQNTRKTLADAIIEDLEAHDGLSTLTDKSSPEDIFARFKVSKAAYKKAIGSLYKDRKISIDKNCLKLQNDKDNK
jgi:predicted RNA-binding protein (virulence factor B family)